MIVRWSAHIDTYAGVYLSDLLEGATFVQAKPNENNFVRHVYKKIMPITVDKKIYNAIDLCEGELVHINSAELLRTMDCEINIKEIH